MRRRRFSGLLLLLLAIDARAQTTTSTDKSQFTLFNATPTSAMREMVTDRPSITESPITVDAGHFQVEFSYVEFSRNNDRSERTDTVDVLPMNLKAGLLNNVDLQLVFTPYENVRTASFNAHARSDGLGDDTELRLKINLWGNDGGSDVGETAFGLMPFIKFPTGTRGLSNDHIEGGLIVPFSVHLPAKFDLGAMAEFDIDYNEDRNRYGVEFVHTITLVHDIPGIEHLNGYIEYAGFAPNDTASTYRAVGSVGLAYEVNENLILDCGGTVGLSHDADDYTLFIGTSIRF